MLPLWDGSSRKENLKRHEAICIRSTLNGFSSPIIEGDALPHSISQALSSPAAPNSGVVVSWPSPASRQSGRERPRSIIDRFVADSPPSSTIVALSPPSPIPVISIESHAACPEDVDSGSDIEVEDETSFYERRKPDRAKGSVEGESGTSQNRRKSRIHPMIQKIHSHGAPSRELFRTQRRPAVTTGSRPTIMKGSWLSRTRTEHQARITSTTSRVPSTISILLNIPNASNVLLKCFTLLVCR